MIGNNFNLEDKIQWQEWAPSLQDRLKSIIATIGGGGSYIYHYISAVRVTIGDTQPLNPVPYGEVWWDTRFEVWRVLTDEGWIMTRATWYNGSNADVRAAASIDSPISQNPRTNCHCYIINWENAQYCHCKTQESVAPSTTINHQTDLAFNYDISASATRYWKWVITSTAVSTYEQIVISTLNAIDKDHPNTNAIIPLDGVTTKYAEEYGDDYVEYDSKYSPMFSTDTTKTCSFVQGTTYYIPFTFKLPKTLINIYGTLSSFSSGPVTITLQASYDNGSTYTTIKSITLTGNYMAAITCHSHCHCDRW